MDAEAAQARTEELCAQISNADPSIIACARLVGRSTVWEKDQYLDALWTEVVPQVEDLYEDVWRESRLLLDTALADNVVLILALDALLASFARGIIPDNDADALSDRWLRTLSWTEHVRELPTLARQAFISASPTWNGSFLELLNASTDATQVRLSQRVKVQEETLDR
jgi:hypothetical protein